MSEKWPISSPFRLIAIEARHVHFLGKAVVKEIIEKAVQKTYDVDHWNFENNFDGEN